MGLASPNTAEGATTMKNSDVQVGATYLVKVADNLVPVKLVREHPSGGWEGVSAKTGKTIRIKSAQRLRKRLADASWSTSTPEENRRRHADQSKAIRESGDGNACLTEPAAQDATDAFQRDTDERGTTGAKREAKPMSLLDAAAHLLSLGTGDPMRCKDIVDLAVARGLWTPRDGKTPANTLYAAISREIKTKGDASRFAKAERGKFTLKG